jgi:transposase InsO family protein
MNTGRSTRLEPGAVVTFRAETWRVTGLDSLRVYLSPFTPGGCPAVWLINEIMAADDFEVVVDSDGVAVLNTEPAEYSDQHLFDSLESEEQHELQRRLEAVLLLRDARIPGAPLDPELASLSQRARLPLLATRYTVSERTLKYWLKAFREGGLAGLVDRRVGSQTGTVVTRIDACWREAIRVVFSEYPDQSNVTDGYLVEQVRTHAENHFGDKAPAVSDRTLRRYIDVLAPGRKHSTKTQRSRANAPGADQWWKPLRPSRPGQVVAIDTQYLDAFALEPVSGEWQRVQLLMAVDVYSRSIVGWRFTGWAPTGQDISLLLRHIVSPKNAEPDWPAQGLWRYTGVPENVVAGLLDADPLHDSDDDHEASQGRIAGIPVVFPDEITLDHGRDYMSDDVRRACDVLGITIGLARPYTPTDKAHIERAFKSVNTGFVQRLPGYKGPDIASRGAAKYVEDAAFYTIDEIEQRFAVWVAIEYQNAPHEGLRHPSLPKTILTPNQMIDVAMATSGFIPIPIDTNLQIELLSTAWRKVTDEGIRVGNLSYDFPGASVLDDFRNKPAPYGSQQNSDGERRWRIKVDRRDLSSVWFFAYTTPNNPEPGVGQWVRVPLRDLPDAVPFQDRHLAYAKRLAMENGRTDRDSLVRHLRQVLTTISHPGDQLTAAEKRLVAHAHAHQLAAKTATDRGLLPPLPEDDDEQYYTGPKADDDAEPTTVNHTTTVSPLPASPTHDTTPLRAGTPFASDQVEEWDPLADDLPDIA